jgi:hypothetical protein
VSNTRTKSTAARASAWAPSVGVWSLVDITDTRRLEDLQFDCPRPRPTRPAGARHAPRWACEQARCHARANAARSSVDW